MIQFDAASFYRVTTMLASIRTGTDIMIQNLSAERLAELERSGGQMQSPGWLEDLEEMRRSLEGLQLPMSLKTFDRYMMVLREPGTQMVESVRLLAELWSRLQDELETRYFFRIASADAELLTSNFGLFGPEVESAFPSAIFDITEASKCRALGRWTASVMHLMRALDVALLAFQKNLEVPRPKENWQQILDQIEAAIKGLGHRHPDHQWNCEASAYFRTLKDAWRNFAMHGKDRYDEERAVSVYDHVRGFMRHLALRLTE